MSGYSPLDETSPHAQPWKAYENIELQYPHSPSTPKSSSPLGPPPAYYNGGNASSTTNLRQQPAARPWPKQPERVARITPMKGFMVFFDCVLASMPIMFIALASVAARLDGSEVGDYGHKLQQILLLSPTVFPVLFAALMGRCFKCVGLYLAEQGTTLGRLEQFVGCQSLFSALERQICLRSSSILGVVLTLIWLLSPLGGQSALRILGQERNQVNSTDTLNYLNPAAVGGSFLTGASSANQGRSTYTSLFLAALLSSTKYQNTPMDLWGNVKLPLYSAYENSTSDDWKGIPHGDGVNITYASLIGVPVAGIPAAGLSSFNIKARQWDISCDSNEEMNQKDSEFGNVTATWKLDYALTEDGERCKGYPCPFVFKSIDSTYNFSVAVCSLSYEYVEAQVSCNETDCRADKMRKLDLLGDGYTQDLDLTTRNVMIALEMERLPTVDNYGVDDAGVRGSTNMEKWMMNPWNFIGASYTNVDLYKLPPSVLSERLTVLWNTFSQSTYATTALGGNLPKNLTELSVKDAWTGFNETTAKTTEEKDPVYKTDWRWFSVMLVASIILQAAAYTALVLKYITLAPDIIGYASSLTLLNPYLPAPAGGTALSGLERAAVLHDMPVRIGDVCANQPVGAIALASATNEAVGKLDRKRFYI